VAHLRQNAIHQATAHIVAKTKPDNERPSVIVLEDLNVVGMMQNHKLARAIGDVGLGEFSRQMSYKCAWYGIASRPLLTAWVNLECQVRHTLRPPSHSLFVAEVVALA
jgi:putative transposase